METRKGNQRKYLWEKAENKSIITHIQHKEAKKAHSNKPEKEVSQTKFQYDGIYFNKSFNNLGD